MSPLSLQELQALALEPSWADIDPAARTYLLVDLAELDQAAGSVRAKLGAWLRAQPIPVIGVGPSSADDSQPVDVVLADQSSVTTIIEEISRRPQAAAIGTQVLRASLGLSPLDALAMESMGYATLQHGKD